MESVVTLLQLQFGLLVNQRVRDREVKDGHYTKSTKSTIWACWNHHGRCFRSSGFPAPSSVPSSSRSWLALDEERGADANATDGTKLL